MKIQLNVCRGDSIVKLAQNSPPKNLSLNAILLSPKLFLFGFVSFVVELATTLEYQVAKWLLQKANFIL